MALPFTWGDGGQKITGPDQAKRARDIALALQNRPAADSWQSGLANLTNGFAGMKQERDIAEQEAAGRERAGGLFADLAINSDPNAIMAALTSPDSAWASPAQTSIASALLNQGLEQQDPMYRAKLAQLQNEAAAGGKPPTSFGTPIWGTDPDGNPVFGTLDNAGAFNVTDTPEGFSFGKDPIKVDGGTEWILLDPVTRQPVGTIPKNNEAAAYETAMGTATGKTDAEILAARESTASKLPGLKQVVSQLGDLAKTATYTQTGQLIDNVTRELGGEMSPAAVDRAKYIAMVDNQVLPLLRDTFGAAFTQKEGETLRATLGDANKSPVEKQAILDAFIQQKERDVLGMDSNMAGTSAPAATGGYTILGVE
jgi:hypothetical protein